MQFADRFKYMVPYTASYIELTFSSKRQWVPRRPLQISQFRGDGKKNFSALTRRPRPLQTLDQVSAADNDTRKRIIPDKSPPTATIKFKDHDSK